MSQRRTFTRTMIGLVAVGTLLGLAACAPEPEPTPTPTAAPETPEPAAYDGPLHFVGDELDWFVLSADEIAATIPGASDITEPTASLDQISDGHGAVLTPEICGVFLSEASLGSIGARTVTWTTATAEPREGQFHVLQFADTEQAQRRMDDYVAAANACAEFTVDGTPSTFTSSVVDDDEGVRAVAGSLVLDYGNDQTWRTHYGVASVGNVLVEFLQTFDGDTTLDAAAAARLLNDRAVQARDLLVGELTATPPVPREESTPDAAAPWSQWDIGFDAVGPLRLGEPLTAVLAAAPGAEVVEPGDGIGEWMLAGPEEGAELFIVPQQDATAVVSIRAGVISAYGEPVPDGAPLPRAAGVGVGDPIESAIAAFPDGTAVHIIAAGLDHYAASTRDGRVLLFHSDRAVGEPGATIIGITAEDGTLGRQFFFGAQG